METEIKEQSEASMFLHKLSEDFIKDLQDTGLGFADEMSARIGSALVEFGLKGETQFVPEFSSEVTLYLNAETIRGLMQKRCINFGSSGSFTPEDKGCYTRTKHALLVLDNWDLVFSIAEKYAEKYRNYKPSK